MDTAYDHIVEESYSADRPSTPTLLKSSTSSSAGAPRPNLNAEFQETFRAFSSSPWGAKIGGLWGTVRKQGESYIEGAKREVEEASGEALKGFTDLKDNLVSRTRGVSFGGDGDSLASASKESVDTITPVAADGFEAKKRTKSEVALENESLITRLRSEAAKRLKDIEKAEDAADEALLRFGTNVRNFFREAVAIAPPTEDPSATTATGNVLFESKDPSGKRVIHTTRFDAQLHVIHCSTDSFTKDPVSGEWAKFKDEFQIDEKTDDISQDLDKYPDLRNAMEQLVPEKVEYKDFWCRYYFLRLVIETEETRRKELLKGASSQNAGEEEVAWDEDSDDEKGPSTPQPKNAVPVISLQDNDSSAMPEKAEAEAGANLKPEGRKSHDLQSQAGSDASYDLVSGASSRAPGSPKEEKPKAASNEDSDEEDWE